MIIISNKETYANVCQHYEEDINTFKDLKDDWDGEGSAEITENLITETMIFISKLKSTFEEHNLKFIYPDIFPGDGNIGLEWTTDKFELDIIIDEKSDLIPVVGFTPQSKYFEKWHRNRVNDGFVEWITEALK